MGSSQKLGERTVALYVRGVIYCPKQTQRKLKLEEQKPIDIPVPKDMSNELIVQNYKCLEIHRKGKIKGQIGSSAVH